jgi:hypothetical protein
VSARGKQRKKLTSFPLPIAHLRFLSLDMLGATLSHHSSVFSGHILFP